MISGVVIFVVKQTCLALLLENVKYFLISALNQ
jgi:hypothetical protein